MDCIEVAGRDLSSTTGCIQTIQESKPGRSRDRRGEERRLQQPSGLNKVAQDWPIVRLNDVMGWQGKLRLLMQGFDGDAG